MNKIYLDHNASTPLLPEAWEEMRPHFLEHAANPASSHHAGRQARRALEDAREKIAALLDAHPDEVVFTSGATEANNLAVFGLAGEPPGRLIASDIEHPSVTEPLRQLEQRGFILDRLRVDPMGMVTPEAAIYAGAKLLCLMLANHETGTLQPVEALAKAISGACPVHSDAAAAAGKLAISFRKLGVDSLTITAHKFNGPKGIGALLVRRGTSLRPMLLGGHQQQGRRPGTEPVPLAVGMASALEWSVRRLEENTARVAQLRSGFLEGLRRTCPPVVVNGPETGGLPHTLNVSFPGCRAEVLLMRCDLAGIACSTGSACSSGSLLPSPVLKAMGVSEAALSSAMRFSFGAWQEVNEVIEAVSRITLIVKDLRQSIRR